MILNDTLLKQIAERVNEPSRAKARVEDYKRFLLFNGSTQEIVKEAIAREYAKPETVEELSARIIPINICTKIITKLSGVYTQAPLRRVSDRSVSDTQLLEEYVEYMCLDQRMKEANRYFKLFKRNLMEIYVDDLGEPYVRNLPRHTYEVFSFSSLTPNRPDVVVKIVMDDRDPSKQILHVWSDESHFVVNGRGTIIPSDGDGSNPYGKLPFVYINESSFSCDPIPDDDLMRMSIAIPVILTDICWATKYQSNSILWTIGDVGTIPSSPNSVVAMNYGPDGQKPEIGQITPSVDTDKVISMVQTLVAMLLSTKNLSVNTVQANLDASNVASGISKMIDNAESVEDKKDQQEYFRKAEHDLWELISKYMVPYWRNAGLLKPEINKEFSQAFEVDVYFTEPKVLITEQEQIEISKARLEAGFSTLKMELEALYPQLNEEQIEELIIEIEAEKQNKQVQTIEGIDGPDMASQDSYNSDEFNDVRKETLNGAQITAVVELVQFVAAGSVPREAAKNILVTGFNLSDSEANAMLGNAGKGFKIAKEEII